MSARAYSDAELADQLRSLPHWSLADGAIRRVYRTAGWRVTLMVAGAIGHLAEAAWHHPELRLTYGSVEVRLNTHDVGGITAKDFELARKIEEVIGWQPSGGALEGVPADAPYLRPDA